jgi:acetaldehyde dehydrogenase/alcohol dehydrogenase
MGISKGEFEQAVPDLARFAFDDPSWRTNPRMPLLSELTELLWSAYFGRGSGEETRESELELTASVLQ